jgi:sugar (pentulose or hexulose) kinase
MSEFWLGIDCATQSVRGALIDENRQIHLRISEDLAPVLRGDDSRLTQDPHSWTSAIEKIVNESCVFASKVGGSIVAMTISATSGTFVITDLHGKPVAPAAMYNDGRAGSPLARAAAIIKEVGQGSYLFAHTPEFVIAHLSGKPLQEIGTDWSHALKTGVDLHNKSWSSSAIATASELNVRLPEIVAPGTQLGRTALGDIPIYAGMTDGCTAQMSVGSSAVGSAVTTLGTTMVIKIVSPQEVSGPGFYSHLLPQSRWLTGGASNLGGISLKSFTGDVAEWDQKALIYGPSSTVSYPLVGIGERFPIANNHIERIFTSAPINDVDEYRATLEGIAFAERLSYETLASAGALLNNQLFTVGGGSRSKIWNSIRATVLNRTISIVKESGSDIGAAMIACASSQGADLAEGLERFNSSTVEQVNPETNQVAMYREKYQKFLELVGPMKNQQIR